MVNYYHLTKKELSFLSIIETPLFLTDSSKRLTRPVIVVTLKRTGEVKRVCSVSWFRHIVKNGTIAPSLYIYSLYTMF